MDSGSDAIVNPLSFSTTTGKLTIDFSTLAGVSGKAFGTFAVMARSGHFGIGGIQYSTVTAVPEPASIFLLGTLGTGLALALRRRFGKG